MHMEKSQQTPPPHRLPPSTAAHVHRHTAKTQKIKNSHVIIRHTKVTNQKEKQSWNTQVVKDEARPGMVAHVYNPNRGSWISVRVPRQPWLHNRDSVSLSIIPSKKIKKKKGRVGKDANWYEPKRKISSECDYTRNKHLTVVEVRRGVKLKSSSQTNQQERPGSTNS